MYCRFELSPCVCVLPCCAPLVVLWCVVVLRSLRSLSSLLFCFAHPVPLPTQSLAAHGGAWRRGWCVFIVLRAGAFSLCPVSRPALSSLCCCCCMAVLSVHWAEISLRQHRLIEQLSSPCWVQTHGCPGKTGSILCFSRPINKYHVVPFCAVEDSTPGLPQG